MENPPFDILKFLAVTLEESVNQFTNLLTDHLRDIFGEQDVKAGIAKIETHGAQRIRKCVSLRHHDLGPVYFPAGYQHRRGAITEQMDEIKLACEMSFALKGKARAVRQR